jgi:hypothetical protein
MSVPAYDQIILMDYFVSIMHPESDNALRDTL